MIGRFLLRLLPWWLAWVFLLPWWVYVGAALAGAWITREDVACALARQSLLQTALVGQPPDILPLEQLARPDVAEKCGEVHLQGIWRRDVGLVRVGMTEERGFLLFQSIRPPLVFLAVDVHDDWRVLWQALGGQERTDGVAVRGFLDPVPSDLLAQSANWGGTGSEPVYAMRPYFGDRREALESELVANQSRFFGPALLAVCFLIGAVKLVLRRRRVMPSTATTAMRTTAGSGTPINSADPFADGPIVSLRRTGKDVR